MNIETKVGVGDQVFILRKITKTECPVCNGTGKIRIGNAARMNANSFEDAIAQVAETIVNGIVNNSIKEYTCPECGGKGTVSLPSDQRKYEVLSCKVTAMQFTIGVVDAPPVILYSVKTEDGKVRKLTENQFYMNRDDAEKQCFIANLKRMEMPLADIQVPYCFASTIPCNEKLNKRLDEYRKMHRFETEIYVDEFGKLFDGYTAYLVYKMLGYERVPVVVWPKIKTQDNNENSNDDMNKEAENNAVPS